MFNKLIAVVIIAFAFFVGHLNAESCISCSSKEDPKCAQYPWQIAPKQCTNHGPEVECYVRIIDGVTIRGCTDEMDKGVLEKCQNDSSNCTTCRNIAGIFGCNKKIFLQYRLRCHACSGDLKSNCSKTIDSTDIPIAPSSAAMWKYSTIFVTALVAYTLASLV